MSQPKKRKHPHHTDTPKPPSGKIYYRIIPVAVFIFLLFGIGIAFFAVGSDTSSLVTGALIGAACGFLFGYQVAKGLSKK
jgi:membrane associated rhomboid family serine protease